MGYRGDLCVGSRASLPGDLMVVEVSTELLPTCFPWILESGREQNPLFLLLGKCVCLCIHTYADFSEYPTLSINEHKICKPCVNT